MNATNHPWESIYKREGRVFIDPPLGFKAVVKEFVQHQCHLILDLGCGNGRHTVALAKEGFNTIGLDISSSGLRLSYAWLGEEGLQAGLVSADARNCFPFKANSFDGLLSTQVIHHALLSEVRTTIAEIWRVLTNGGVAFVTVAGRKQEGEAYEEVEPGTYIPLGGTEKGLPHHIFTEEELRLEFKMFQIREISQRDEGRVIALWIAKIVQGT
jgi:ubiquinone/menaquinone biosynthesis C-methylase UbiE